MSRSSQSSRLVNSDCICEIVNSAQTIEEYLNTMSELISNTRSQPVILNTRWYPDARRNILQKGGKPQEIDHQIFVELDYFVRREQQVFSKLSGLF